MKDPKNLIIGVLVLVVVGLLVVINQPKDEPAVEPPPEKVAPAPIVVQEVVPEKPVPKAVKKVTPEIVEDPVPVYIPTTIESAIIDPEAPPFFEWSAMDYEFVYNQAADKFSNLYNISQKVDLTYVAEDGDPVCICIEETIKPFRTWCSTYIVSTNAYDKPWQEFKWIGPEGVPTWLVDQQTAKPLYTVVIHPGTCEAKGEQP